MVSEDGSYSLLLVDDEADVLPMFRQSMRTEIRSGRYSLMFASNGVEALEVLEREPGVDLVITDINMPDMDGLELLERLGELDRDLRTVVMSAYGDMKNIRRAMGLGAADFVSKPIDFTDLLLTVERTLRALVQGRESAQDREQLAALRRDLFLAARIQASILPSSFPPVDGWDIFASAEPARVVAGDFYDLVSFEAERRGFFLADVSGKGIPAALLMMSTRTLLKGASIGLGAPGRVLSEVNDMMCSENPSSMFVTTVFCSIGPRSGLVRYAGAGHPPGLLVQPDGTSEFLPLPPGGALGLIPGDLFSEFEVSLSSGSVLLLYTDGVTDAESPDGDTFGSEGLRRVFAPGVPGSARECVEQVCAAVREFCGDMPQADDVTCAALLRT